MYTLNIQCQCREIPKKHLSDRVVEFKLRLNVVELNITINSMQNDIRLQDIGEGNTSKSVELNVLDHGEGQNPLLL